MGGKGKEGKGEFASCLREEVDALKTCPHGHF